MECEYHICKPIFRVISEGEGLTDAREVRARNAEDAATLWVRNYDAGHDYHVANGGYIEIVVISPDGVVETYEVQGEIVPSYSVSSMGTSEASDLILLEMHEQDEAMEDEREDNPYLLHGEELERLERLVINA